MLVASPPLAATLAYMYAMLPGFIGPSAFASRANLSIISLASSASFATALAVFAASMFSLISVAFCRIDLLALLSSSRRSFVEILVSGWRFAIRGRKCSAISRRESGPQQSDYDILRFDELSVCVVDRLQCCLYVSAQCRGLLSEVG